MDAYANMKYEIDYGESIVNYNLLQTCQLMIRIL